MPFNASIVTIDPDSVFFGLAGTDAGYICILEPNGKIRRATRAERSLALLIMPHLRALVGRTAQ